MKLVKRLAKAVLLPLLAIAVLLPAQTLSAAAQEYRCEASIPVETAVEGNGAPADTAFAIKLEALSEQTPLPEKTELEIKGGGSASFGPIVYGVPGDYRYRVTQTKGNAAHFTYDETVYSVTVRVTNRGAAAADGLQAEIWAVRNDSEDKAMQIRFVNRYQAPSPSNPGGDSQNPSSDPQEPAVTPQPTLPKTNAVTPGTGTQVLPVTDGNALPQTGGDHGARTGDESRMTLWLTVALAALAALAVVGACLYRRRKER